MSLASPTLARVVGGQLCTGCGACAGISGGAIAMGSLPPGYARPQVRQPVSADLDGRIAAICPGNRVAPWPEAPASDPYWGPYRRC